MLALIQALPLPEIGLAAGFVASAALMRAGFRLRRSAALDADRQRTLELIQPVAGTFRRDSNRVAHWAYRCNACNLRFAQDETGAGTESILEHLEQHDKGGAL
jgi:hypothetical protein